MMCFADGLPFYGMSILATIFFGGILFGAHHFLNKGVTARKLAN
jgi:hypothetical protein